VLVIGVGLGWIVRSAHIQRDAVAAIKNAGGTVAYNWEWDHGKRILGGEPWAPSWLVEFTGVDFFGHVTHVGFEGRSRPADTVLAEVGRLNQLQRLWLSNTSVITEAELVDLNGLTKIAFVVVNSSQVTDAGPVHLNGLANLSILSLEGTQVTDAWLVHLKGLTNLSDLSLYGTQVTDAGLVHLKGLTNLSVLDLRDTQVTDAGLVHLRGLTNLSTLRLGGYHVTDPGLVHLKGLTNLSTLWLWCPQVTDLGLVHLKGLTNLSILSFGGQATVAGMNELKQALPRLKIYQL
jgi:Leucine-rich repeat (LRR) protein